MKKIIANYKNGSNNITIFEDGTKIRRIGNPEKIEFPESLDIKITNKCNNNCYYCFENSTNNGNEANFDLLIEQLNYLPDTGIEIALGGGNPLYYSKLIPLLKYLKNKNFISSITIHQNDIKNNFDLIKYIISEKLIYGLGVSIVSNEFKYIKMLNYPYIVLHTIVGITPIELIIETRKELNKYPILYLGFKNIGRATTIKQTYINNNILKLKEILPILIPIGAAFDNLAIEQLDIKKNINSNLWNILYMGDEGKYSIYINAVEKYFSPSSTNNKFKLQYPQTNIIDFFNKLQRRRNDNN